MRGLSIDGDKVLALRKSLCLTQEQLAAAAGCDTKTVRKAEKSHHIDHTIVELLAAVFGVGKQVKVTAIASGQTTHSQAAHEFELQGEKIMSHRIFANTHALAQIIDEIEVDRRGQPVK